MERGTSLALTPIQNTKIDGNRRATTALDLEGTPVGDRSNAARIQLCLELRKKPLVTKGTKKNFELVLEVVVMKIRNLSYLLQTGGAIGESNTPIKTSKKRKGLAATDKSTFVKIRLIPDDIIHSTELKLVKEYGGGNNNLDFIEVFSFPVKNVEELEGKRVQFLVCDSAKMTRNSKIYGKAIVECLEKISLEKRISQWFNLTADKD